MYHITVVSLLPELIKPVSKVGVLGRACDEGLFSLEFISPRDFAKDTHRTVDDRPYGGGPGMVLKYEPLRDAICEARKRIPNGCAEYVLSPRGEPFDQSLAQKLADGPGLLLVAGRYEGIDERIFHGEVPNELSLGDFVLSGGELAAAVVIDTVVRLIPGVLGHKDSLTDDSFMNELLGYPQYTRPVKIDEMMVPEVLIEGHHQAIRRWRLKQSLGRTWLSRPELLKSQNMNAEEKSLLDEYIEELGRKNPKN
ncbi:MAG: tRNA (guanosine(37)-N1)-methyltransferase TrmD [Rhodospirillaceae bacterium]|nr:tRNA (guanosine(37)-N1)-methyltransferase TrmD [Rhodospirillaceae bacterium]